MNKNIRQKTIDLIDELKAVCTTSGLGNDGNEYKIITQIFLYKYINDKFGHEFKNTKLFKLNSEKKWESQYENLSKEEQDLVSELMDPNIPILKPQHIIGNLWKQQKKDNFAEIFDNVMIEISDSNSDIFSTQTTLKTKVELFEKLTHYVTDDDLKNNFAKSLIDRLNKFSFEEAFKQNYDFFASIFEYLIKDYNTAGGGKYAEYYTPHSIATIMARLLVGDNPNIKNVEIYDPSAGTGTLLMALSHQIGEDKCTIFSQDISQRSNKMLKLNLILNGLVTSLDNVIQGDTLKSPYHKNKNGNDLKEFDFVVSNPPFKTDFSETRDEIALNFATRFKDGVPSIPKNKKSSMAIYTLFIQHVIHSLNKKGKGAIVVPTGFITSKTGVESKILKRLVEDKIIYGCISMPSNVFANTGTNVSVLFFDKSNLSNEVILIDASKMGEEYKESGLKKRRLTKNEVDKIIKVFRNKESVDDFSTCVSYDKIKEKNYSLSAGQYFDIKIEYVEITEQEFINNTKKIGSELESYFKESEELGKEILSQLKKIKYNKEK